AQMSSPAVPSAGPPGPACIGRPAHPESDGHRPPPAGHRPQGGETMAGKSIKGSKSHENLKEAFAGESQANRRYLYFARVADIEGFPDMAGLFKDTADAETGH